MIKVGANSVAVKLGTTAIARAYVGTTRVLGSDPAPPAFEEHSKTTSLTGSITVPSTAQVDDFALLVSFAANPAPSDTTPSGWTQLQTVTSTTGVGHRVTSYGKVIVSGDINASVSVLSSGSDGCVLFILRNVGYTPFGPLFAASDLASETNIAGDPASQTINAPGVPGINVGIKYTYGGTSAFSTNPFDSTQIITDGSVGSLLVGYEYISGTASDSTFDSADDGNAQIQASFHVSFNSSL